VEGASVEEVGSQAARAAADDDRSDASVLI
jgi:hypothetical protein